MVVVYSSLSEEGKKDFETDLISTKGLLPIGRTHARYPFLFFFLFAFLWYVMLQLKKGTVKLPENSEADFGDYELIPKVPNFQHNSSCNQEIGSSSKPYVNKKGYLVDEEVFTTKGLYASGNVTKSPPGVRLINVEVPEAVFLLADEIRNVLQIVGTGNEETSYNLARIHSFVVRDGDINKESASILRAVTQMSQTMRQYDRRYLLCGPCKLQPSRLTYFQMIDMWPWPIINSSYSFCMKEIIRMSLKSLLLDHYIVFRIVTHANTLPAGGALSHSVCFQCQLLLSTNVFNLNETMFYMHCFREYRRRDTGSTSEVLMYHGATQLVLMLSLAHSQARFLSADWRISSSHDSRTAA
ncbi:hypothetical protein YC2023_008100 [Brassica napus]